LQQSYCHLYSYYYYYYYCPSFPDQPPTTAATAVAKANKPDWWYSQLEKWRGFAAERIGIINWKSKTKARLVLEEVGWSNRCPKKKEHG